MHPAPVATTDSQPTAVPYWVTGDPAPDRALDLAIYPEEDEGIDELIAETRPFEGLRAAENVFSRIALIAAMGLFSWMLIGLALAWHAGRI